MTCVGLGVSKFENHGSRTYITTNYSKALRTESIKKMYEKHKCSVMRRKVFIWNMCSDTQAGVCKRHRREQLLPCGSQACYFTVHSGVEGVRAEACISPR